VVKTLVRNSTARQAIQSVRSVPFSYRRRRYYYDAVFYRTDPLLDHKFEKMVIFPSGNLYSLCSPGNQDYHKIDTEKIVFIGISCN